MRKWWVLPFLIIAMVMLFMMPAYSGTMDMDKTDSVELAWAACSPAFNDGTINVSDVTVHYIATNAIDKATPEMIASAEITSDFEDEYKKMSATEAEAASLYNLETEVGNAGDAIGIVVSSSDYLFYVATENSRNTTTTADLNVINCSTLNAEESEAAQTAVIAKWVEGSGFFFEDAEETIDKTIYATAENGTTFDANEVIISI